MTTGPEAGRIRILTQNLWGWYFPTPPSGIGYAPDGDPPQAWTTRTAVLRDGIRRLAPDILVAQEAVVTDTVDMVADLAGADRHVVHQRARQKDGSGATIASRWPIEAVQEVDLHVTDRTKGFPCATLIAQIHAPAPFGRLLVANHNPNWELDFEHERELQAVIAARALEKLAGSEIDHVIVAGDFNVGLSAASMRFWTGLQSLGGLSVSYADAWAQVHPDQPGDTFSPLNPLVAHGTWPQHSGDAKDHILIRRVHHGPTLDVAECDLAFTEPAGGVWASDHFGVIADLVLPPVTPRPTRW